MLTLEEIKKRIGKTEDYQLISDYSGLTFHEETYDDSRIKNYDFIRKNFPEIIISLDDFLLWSHKGGMWWGNKNYIDEVANFAGSPTEDVIFFIQNYVKKFNDIDVPRIVTQKQRFNVLKRQGWKCNGCGCGLKYSEKHEFDAVVGHIDHIHPYSKRDNYPRGKKNINEDCNLQGLCQKCNLTKVDKEIN